MADTNQIGKPVTRGGDHGVSMGLYFHDPDGNGVEVYYELPRDQWYTDNHIFINEDRPSGRFPGPWDKALAK